jgi:hypothetical protein
METHDVSIDIPAVKKDPKKKKKKKKVKATAPELSD